MTRPSTAITARSGSTCAPSLATLPSTVTRPSAMRASLARRDATPAAGEDLLEPLGRHQSDARVRASAPRRRGRRRPADQPRRDRDSPGRSRRPPRPAGPRRRPRAAAAPSRLVSPNRSRNSKPVPYRNGRPGVSARPSSTISRRCRSERIV